MAVFVVGLGLRMIPGHVRGCRVSVMDSISELQTSGTQIMRGCTGNPSSNIPRG